MFHFPSLRTNLASCPRRSAIRTPPDSRDRARKPRTTYGCVSRARAGTMWSTSIATAQTPPTRPQATQGCRARLRIGVRRLGSRGCRAFTLSPPSRSRFGFLFRHKLCRNKRSCCTCCMTVEPVPSHHIPHMSYVRCMCGSLTFPLFRHLSPDPYPSVTSVLLHYQIPELFTYLVII